MSRQLEIDFSGSNSLNTGMQSQMDDLLATPADSTRSSNKADRVMRPANMEEIGVDIPAGGGHRLLPLAALKAGAEKVSSAIFRR